MHLIPPGDDWHERLHVNPRPGWFSSPAASAAARCGVPARRARAWP